MAESVETEPLVSVIVPTYGRSTAHFTRAVESVVAQTYSNVELVVVDDSPSEVSASLAADPPSDLTRVRSLREGGSGGAAAARNTGIRAANGTYLAFLDDDDWWRPRKLSRQVSELDANARLGVSHTIVEHVLDGETLRVGAPGVSGDATVDIYRGESVGTFSALVVDAECVEAAGLIDERLPYLEDREWVLRLSRHCGVAMVPEPLTVYRQGSHEQLTDDYEALRDVAVPRFLEKHRSRARQQGRDVERAFVASLTKPLVLSALKHDAYADARRFAARVVRCQPTDPEAYVYLVAAMGGPLTYRTLKRIKGHVDRVLSRRHRRTTGVTGGSPTTRKRR